MIEARHVAVLPRSFLTDTTPLRGENAVAAIITDEHGRYLMQLRDDVPGIFYPGHWGCFGGAVGPNEDGPGALRRELAEELELREAIAAEFITLQFDLSRLGQKRCYRRYYEMRISAVDLPSLVLHEGAEVRLFAPDELFDLRLAPYDSFALWMHFARHRLSASPVSRTRP